MNLNEADVEFISGPTYSGKKKLNILEMYPLLKL
jgi:hypothetical protein